MSKEVILSNHYENDEKTYYLFSTYTVKAWLTPCYVSSHLIHNNSVL